ncbi:hypothetical protein [Phenylobacterium sp.]|uniref:hypothetical protein n=1 Tax=Phenylobacterium sp. TaxID=1871053 RepID=UPI0035666152
MTKAETDSSRLDVLAEALFLCAGAGLLSSGLTTLMAASDTFSARLASSAAHSAELSALQIRSLAACLADMRAAGQVSRTMTRTRSGTTVVMPPGAPVVT